MPLPSSRRSRAIRLFHASKVPSAEAGMRRAARWSDATCRQDSRRCRAASRCRFSSRCGAPHLLVERAHGSSSLNFDRAQDTPRDIWAQILAANDPAGSLLNQRASLGWNLAYAVAPLADCRGRYLQHARHCSAPADEFAGPGDFGGWCAHAHNVAGLHHICKAQFRKINVAVLLRFQNSGATVDSSTPRHGANGADDEHRDSSPRHDPR